MDMLVIALEVGACGCVPSIVSTISFEGGEVLGRLLRDENRAKMNLLETVIKGLLFNSMSSGRLAPVYILTHLRNCVQTALFSAFRLFRGMI